MGGGIHFDSLLETHWLLDLLEAMQLVPFTANGLNSGLLSPAAAIKATDVSHALIY